MDLFFTMLHLESDFGKPDDDTYALITTDVTALFFGFGAVGVRILNKGMVYTTLMRIV